MSEILDKHIELIEAVNNSKTVAEHDINMARLDGFRIVLDIALCVVVFFLIGSQNEPM